MRSFYNFLTTSLVILLVIIFAGCDLFNDPPTETEANQRNPNSRRIHPSDPPIDPIKLPENVVIVPNIPHITQKPGFCGEACVAMYLQSLGYQISQDDVFNASKLSPNLGRGCYAPDLYRALNNLGFKLESNNKIWHWLSNMNQNQANLAMQKRFNQIVENLNAGYPSICCMHWSLSPKSPEHFRLLIGYDPTSQTIYYQEPATDNKSIHKMSKSEFFKIWSIGSDPKRKCIITFMLKPGKIKTPPKAKAKFKTLKFRNGNSFESKRIKIPNFTDADYAQHILKLKEKPAADNMKYIVCKPFVVAGNMRTDTLKQYARNLVKWSANQYRRHYFKYNPDEILTIYLMRNKQTYEIACQRLMNFTPDTPYGFFSNSNRLLMMNIATGGGTLVHEMFHAYVPANFPAMPAWCNEGFASLYEQSGTVNGNIVGLVNWRLAGLQTAIRNKTTIPLKKLISTTTDQFYGSQSGLHYAMARYLCLYLQEKGKLNKFYKEFYKNQESDPTGINSILKILEITENQLPAFQRDWEIWCANLKY